jgi:hypothetical protein
LKEKKNVTVIEALDKVIGYLHEEQDDYEDTHASERQNHIWNAVHVLMRHRADLSKCLQHDCDMYYQRFVIVGTIR